MGGSRADRGADLPFLGGRICSHRKCDNGRWKVGFALQLIFLSLRKELRFQKPLKHDPVGRWVKSGDWRFLVLNNRALLDQEGEVVCTNINENEATVSYIPPEGLEDKIPVVATLKVLVDISQCNHITITGVNFRHSTSGGQEGPYAWGAESALRFDI